MNFVKIKDYPYVIHPCGTILRIWKHMTKEIKHFKRPDGYMSIQLFNNGKQKDFSVHRLLALHFIHNDDPDTKIEIDHIDSVRDNNNLNNLEWVSRVENMRRMMLKRPAAVITKGNIYKRKCGWRWQYYMSGKKKSKTMKSKTDLEKYREETLKKYSLNL
tara:strand:+ start:47 stop:526 length:480 start_codon:yes stop_codon:yes gene_type:complete